MLFKLVLCGQNRMRGCLPAFGETAHLQLRTSGRSGHSAVPANERCVLNFLPLKFCTEKIKCSKTTK
ncbi:hypothetical protein L596_003320 [Steinernema carpocapsae]|uniref:Uncharacterized protein n=1 Tax=Steinernema carpocapsae TaxID=34508 RepID=A0A4U8UV40_STECR|nr:hypothetical protein L596_003320 [Steinernema carpocapsae]